MTYLPPGWTPRLRAGAAPSIDPDATPNGAATRGMVEGAILAREQAHAWREVMGDRRGRDDDQPSPTSTFL